MRLKDTWSVRAMTCTSTASPIASWFLPTETGEPKQRQTLDQRTKDVLESGKEAFRQRNQHMQGVTFGLRLAFGLAVDVNIERIQFEDESSAHLFEACAMTNLLLCSAVDEGTFKSRATGPMRRSCTRHTRATLGILQPTLVIAGQRRTRKVARSEPGRHRVEVARRRDVRLRRQPIHLGVAAAPVARELALAQVRVLA